MHTKPPSLVQTQHGPSAFSCPLVQCGASGKSLPECPGSLGPPAALLTLQWAQAIKAGRPVSHWASFILAVALESLGSINGPSVCLQGLCSPAL